MKLRIKIIKNMYLPRWPFNMIPGDFSGQLEPSDTVAQLKQKIRSHVSNSRSEDVGVGLLFSRSDQILQDEVRLKEYGIQDRDMICVQFKRFGKYFD